MILLRPIKTNLITQGFGENKSPLYIQWGMLGHNGIDLSAQDGEPIYWYGRDVEGMVLKNWIDDKGGLGVLILTGEDGKHYVHRFWHLKSFACQPGQVLNSGDLIGYADNTGYSTATHLHAFDIREVIKDEFGNWKTINEDNGYKGSLNPTVWFQNMYIKDYMDMLKSQLSIIQTMINAFKVLISIRFYLKK